MWADLTWAQAWRICFAWREILRKQSQGSSAFDIAAGRIRHIWVMRNPEKLRPWTTG